MTAFSNKERGDKAEEDITSKIADVEWQRTVEVLKLLARGVMIKSIAGQFRQSEKWVRSKREKAFNYPPAIMVTLPLEVQDYLIREKEKRGLKTKLEEFKGVQFKAGASQGVSAIELARAKHWEELASLADEIVTLREDYNKGLSGVFWSDYVIDAPSMSKLPSAMLSSLLIHLKHEFSEFDDINDWRELLRKDTADELMVKLALVALRKTLKGTCPFCKY